MFARASWNCRGCRRSISSYDLFYRALINAHALAPLRHSSFCVVSPWQESCTSPSPVLHVLQRSARLHAGCHLSARQILRARLSSFYLAIITWPSGFSTTSIFSVSILLLSPFSQRVSAHCPPEQPSDGGGPGSFRTSDRHVKYRYSTRPKSNHNISGATTEAAKWTKAKPRMRSSPGGSDGRYTT